MALLRTKQLFSGLIPPGAWTTLYVVPPGSRAIVKEAWLSTFAGSGLGPLYMELTDSGEVRGLLVLNATQATGTPVHWQGAAVLTEGQAVRVFATASDTSALVSGAELPLESTN